MNNKVKVALIGAISLILAAIIPKLWEIDQKEEPISVINKDNNSRNSTTGDNSPVINTEGPVTISYRTIENVQELFEEILANRDSKNQEISYLKNRLSKIHQKEFNSIPKEASAWADQFIAAMPIMRDKIQLQVDRKKQLSDKYLTEVPLLFNYTLDFVENRIKELNERIPGFKFIRVDTGKIFLEQGKEQSNSEPSIIIFPNSHRVEIQIRRGHTIDGFVVGGLPSLNFIPFPNKHKPGYPSVAITIAQSSIIFGGGSNCHITYSSALSVPMLNDKFKKNLSGCFERLIAGVLSIE